MVMDLYNLIIDAVNFVIHKNVDVNLCFSSYSEANVFKNLDRHFCINSPFVSY